MFYMRPGCANGWGRIAYGGAYQGPVASLAGGLHSIGWYRATGSYGHSGYFPQSQTPYYCQYYSPQRSVSSMFSYALNGSGYGYSTWSGPAGFYCYMGVPPNYGYSPYGYSTYGNGNNSGGRPFDYDPDYYNKRSKRKKTEREEEETSSTKKDSKKTADATKTEDAKKVEAAKTDETKTATEAKPKKRGKGRRRVRQAKIDDARRKAARESADKANAAKSEAAKKAVAEKAVALQAQENTFKEFKTKWGKFGLDIKQDGTKVTVTIKEILSQDQTKIFIDVLRELKKKCPALITKLTLIYSNSENGVALDI